MPHRRERPRLARMTTLAASPASTAALLTDDMLARFGERAPVYDRENRFFDEDFEDLRASGYLTCNVPVDLGGRGSCRGGRWRRACSGLRAVC